MCNTNLSAIIISEKVYSDSQTVATLLKIAAQNQGLEIFSLSVLLAIIGKRIYTKYFSEEGKNGKKTTKHSRVTQV